MSTDTRPSLGRHIDRVSVDISAECRSPYRPIVSTDTRSTDALSTHDPNTLSLMEELFIEVSWIQPLSVSDYVLDKLHPSSLQREYCTTVKCKITEFVGRFLVSRTTLLELISTRPRYNWRSKSFAMPPIYMDCFKNTFFKRIVFKYNVAW